MPNPTHLEQLLSNSIQKLNAFVDVLRMEKYNDIQHANALNEWAAAESMYTAYLKSSKFNQISPDDAIAG